MSLDILDHPVVERLIMGETIQVQELRDALVEFWEKNNTFSLCANCPVSSASAVGCCGTCEHHDVKKGCTLRNISCLTYSCQSLENRLSRQGVLESYKWFSQMFRGPLFGEEPFFNRSRLPDDARLELRHNPESSFRPLEIVVLDGVEGIKAPNKSQEWRPNHLGDKLGESGIRCRVSQYLYDAIIAKYPDSPVYVDEEYVAAFRKQDKPFESTLRVIQ